MFASSLDTKKGYVYQSIVEYVPNKSLNPKEGGICYCR